VCSALAFALYHFFNAATLLAAVLKQRLALAAVVFDVSAGSNGAVILDDYERRLQLLWRLLRLRP
jgi:hypothetical protein